MDVKDSELKIVI